MNTVLLAGVGLANLAVLLDILSLAIPNWLSTQDGTFGLFSTCQNVGMSVCFILSKPVFEWLPAVQALLILSVLSMGAGFGQAVLFAFFIRTKKCIVIGAAFFSFVGGCLAITGVVIFGVNVRTENDYKGHLGSGFGLAIASATLAIFASVFFICSKERNEYRRFGDDTSLHC